MHRYNSPRIHQEFLERLNAVLPEGCRPIMVTDAGFRGPWIPDVQAFGCVVRASGLIQRSTIGIVYVVSTPQEFAPHMASSA